MPKLTSKGQVTIPQKIRVLLGINAGDEITFEVEGGEVHLKKKRVSQQAIKKYVGFLSHLEPKTSDEILVELRGPG